MCNELGLSPSASAMNKIAESYASTPTYIFMARCLIMQRDNFTFVRFEVPKVITVKNASICDVMPCTLVYYYQGFGGTCSVHLQGRRIS
jgi:hypothetical protein